MLLQHHRMVILVADRAPQSADSRKMLQELEQQAKWRMKRWRASSWLHGWRAYAQSCTAGRSCLEDLQLRTQRRRFVFGVLSYSDRRMFQGQLCAIQASTALRCRHAFLV